MNETQQRLLDLLGRPSAPESLSAKSWTPSQWETLIAEAGRHNLQPLLCHRITSRYPDISIPPGQMQRLKSAHRAAHFANFLRFQLLGRVLAGLKKAGVPVIVLKGAFLAQKVYQDIGQRPMIDVDLLVKPQDLENSDAVMAGCGFRRLEYNLETSPQTNEFHYQEEKSQASFEIHWELIRPDYPFQIPAGLLWETAVTEEISGVETLTLTPEYLLLHLALHASKHGFNHGLRALCDIDETLTRLSVSWPLMAEIISAHGLSRPVQTPVFLARELLGTSLPANVADWIRPSSLRPEILDEAREAVLLNSGDANLQRNLLLLIGRNRRRDKAHLLLSRMFIPRRKLATLYPVSASSPWVFFFYPHHIWKLLKRNMSGLHSFLGGEKGGGKGKKGAAGLLDWLLTKE